MAKWCHYFFNIPNGPSLFIWSVKPPMSTLYDDQQAMVTAMHRYNLSFKYIIVINIINIPVAWSFSPYFTYRHSHRCHRWVFFLSSLISPVEYGSHICIELFLFFNERYSWIQWTWTLVDHSWWDSSMVDQYSCIVYVYILICIMAATSYCILCYNKLVIVFF